MAETASAGSQPEPAVPEPITVQKAVGGLIDPKNTIKAGVFSFHIGMIILVILGGISVFNFFFPKKSSNIQKQTSSVTFAKGSTPQSVTVINQQQQNVQKKTVGLSVSVSSVDVSAGFKKYINDNWSVEVGPRWTFDTAEGTKHKVVPYVTAHYDFY